MQKWLKNRVLDLCNCGKIEFVVVQLLSCVQLFATQWTAGHQTSRSFTVSWSLFKLMSIELVMPSNHLEECLNRILCFIFEPKGLLF